MAVKDDHNVLETADQEYERLLLGYGLHFSLGKVEGENGNQSFCSRIPLKKKVRSFLNFRLVSYLWLKKLDIGLNQCEWDLWMWTFWKSKKGQCDEERTRDHWTIYFFLKQQWFLGENNVKKATQISTKLIICGDFNIDMKSPNNPKTKHRCK